LLGDPCFLQLGGSVASVVTVAGVMDLLKTRIGR